MSILINNDLIWVSVPRCASLSIETTLLSTSNLIVEYCGDYESITKKNKEDKYLKHYHYDILELYNYFGFKESVCIKRDWFDRWLSALENVFESISQDNFHPIVEWKDVDNKFIYDVFNMNFSNDLYTINNDEKMLNCYSKFIKEDYKTAYKNSVAFPNVGILRSQNYFKNNTPCTYEFDIFEISKFENFIENKYNVEFKLPALNCSKKIKNNIIIDNNLKNWIWKIFESPYKKSGSFI